MTTSRGQRGSTPATRARRWVGWVGTGVILTTGLAGCGGADTSGRDALTVSHARAAQVVGRYQVTGDILSSSGYLGEQAGDQLRRDWSITSTCTGGRCELTLTRDLAAVSGVTPISAVMRPTGSGWSARFTETQACGVPGSGTTSTETSNWTLRLTRGGIQAFERGVQPATPGGCAAAVNVIRWSATRIPAPAPAAPAGPTV